MQRDDPDSWILVDNSNSEPPELFEVQQDYFQIEKLMEKWQVPNKHRPFAKNVVCILGTTSSGKSSFVNHFFKVGAKKVAVFQLDTHFTLIETVPEDEFKHLVPGYKYVPYTEEELARSVADAYSDERRNTVYVALDTSSTLARHDQFENFSKVFRKHELIECILINEAYLHGSPRELATIKNTILIDSPGFTSETQLQKLKGNLEILQYIFTLSDLTLFFIPSDSINLVSSQISMLELSILYAFHGKSTFNEVLVKILQSKDAQKSNFSFGITDLFNIVVRNMGKSAEQPEMYSGTVYWDKVKFILSKMDRVTDRPGAEAQFFELGTTLGSNLRFLKPPVFDQCFAISLPEQQQVQSHHRPAEDHRYSSSSRVREHHYEASSSSSSSSSSARQPPMVGRDLSGKFRTLLVEDEEDDDEGRLQTGMRPSATSSSSSSSSSGASARSSRQPPAERPPSSRAASSSHSSSASKPNTMDLQRLLFAISSLNYFDSYMMRLESSIQMMCDDLKQKIEESWWHTAYLSRPDSNVIDALYKRSKHRTRSRLTKDN